MIKYPKICKACEMFILTPLFKQMNEVNLVVTSNGDGKLSEPVEIKRHPLCPTCEPKYTAWADSIHERINK